MFVEGIQGLAAVNTNIVNNDQNEQTEVTVNNSQGHRRTVSIGV